MNTKSADSIQNRFEPYTGDLMGLAVNEHHLVFRWTGPGKVLFSVCRKGNAASCHFASDKAGLRHIKQVVNDLSAFCFWLFPWCEMCLANVSRPSVGRLIEKCGYTAFAESDKGTFYMRARQ